MKTKWVKTAEVIGATDIESSADGVFFSNEQVDSIEASLNANTSTELDEVKRELNTVEQRLAETQTKATDTETALTAAQETISTQTTEIADLKAKLTRKPSAATEVARTGSEEGAVVKTFSEKTASMKHNQWADKMLGKI
jgi:chromosome segregation ATPase